MNSNLQLGPFVLRLQWMVIILSVFVGYLVVRYRLKRVTDFEDRAKERIIETIDLNQALIWFSLGQVFILFLSPLKQFFGGAFPKPNSTFKLLQRSALLSTF